MIDPLSRWSCGGRHEVNVERRSTCLGRLKVMSNRCRRLFTVFTLSMVISVTSERHVSTTTVHVNGQAVHTDEIVHIYTVEPLGHVDERARGRGYGRWGDGGRVGAVMGVWTIWLVLIYLM